MARNHPGIPQEVEDSEEDKTEDKREAKKRGMSVAAWEGSPDDERLDRQHAKRMRHARRTRWPQRIWRAP